LHRRTKSVKFVRVPGITPSLWKRKCAASWPVLRRTNRGFSIMNLDHPNTLDQQPHPETLASYGATDPAQSGKPRKHWWVWLVLLVVVGVGVYYYFHSRANAAASAAQGPAGKGGKGAGAIPVVVATATKGDIGVYFTGLG